MAEHVVPQDVEADDKLIGPFGLRQVIYLLIAAGAGFLAFLLTKIAIPLLIIPLPIMLFFLVIALPLRKDQPTEIYLAAIIKYLMKPHDRIWKADGEQPLVEISAPIVDDSPRTKDLAGEEVSRRLSFLSNLSDTQGWSTRGISGPVNNTNLSDEFASDAYNAVDVMENSDLSNNIDNLLDKSDQRVRENAVARMNQLGQVKAELYRQNDTSNLTTIKPRQSATPDISNPTSLPTYGFNAPLPSNVDFSRGNGDLQRQIIQPQHNQQLAVPSIQPQPQPQPQPVEAQVVTPNVPEAPLIDEQPVKTTPLDNQPVIDNKSDTIEESNDTLIDIKLR